MPDETAASDIRQETARPSGPNASWKECWRFMGDRSDEQENPRADREHRAEQQSYRMLCNLPAAQATRSDHSLKKAETDKRETHNPQGRSHQ